MNRLLYVITSYLGPSVIGIGDSLLHTPIIRWFKHELGFALDIGGFQEFEWIFTRCPSVDTFETIQSPAEAAFCAGNRFLIMADHLVDEYEYYQTQSYTQLLARRLGIPGQQVSKEKIDYQPTETDRSSAKQLLQDLKIDGKPLITLNTTGKTRKNQPGLKPDQYLEICSRLGKEIDATILIGDSLRLAGANNMIPTTVDLPTWAALIEQSDLWIGECTGPYYLACALETPTMMFCARNPENPFWTADHYSDADHYIFEDVTRVEPAVEQIIDIIQRQT